MFELVTGRAAQPVSFAQQASAGKQQGKPQSARSNPYLVPVLDQRCSGFTCTGSHEAPLQLRFRSCSEELFPTPDSFAESDDDWADTEDPAGALLGAQLRPIPMSDELEDVFQSMDRLRVEFEELARPAGLPPFGEPLPREDVAVDRVI